MFEGLKERHFIVGDSEEKQVWTDFAAGNPDTWQKVLDEAIPKLYATFLKSWQNVSLAEELIQKTVFDAVKGRKLYDIEKGSPQQWLFGIAHNNIRMEIRKRAARPSVDGDITEYLEAIDSELLPDEILEKQQTSKLVRKALAEIDDKQAKVLKGMYIEGQSARQIAQQMHLTEKAVHSLLYRARIALRDKLKVMAPEISEVRK